MWRIKIEVGTDRAHRLSGYRIDMVGTDVPPPIKQQNIAALIEDLNRQNEFCGRHRRSRFKNRDRPNPQFYDPQDGGSSSEMDKEQGQSQSRGEQSRSHNRNRAKAKRCVLWRVVSHLRVMLEHITILIVCAPGGRR